MIERTTNIPTLYPLKDLSPSRSFYLYKTQAALREQQNVLWGKNGVFEYNFSSRVLLPPYRYRLYSNAFVYKDYQYQ